WTVSQDIRITTISSGRRRGEFRDVSGLLCSVEESHHLKVPAIWLGCDQMIGGDPSRRMLLTQEMVAALLPHLQGFVAVGHLEESGHGAAPGALPARSNESGPSAMD